MFIVLFAGLLLVGLFILFVKYVVLIKVDVIKIIVFILPAYVIIFIESMTSYELKVMRQTMTRDAFNEWLREILKCKPTLRRGGVKDEALLYDQCIDLTEDSKFIEKMKKITSVIHLELDLCLTFKDGSDNSTKKENFMNRIIGNNTSSVVKCCCFSLSNNVNRPIATLDNFAEHVMICSRRRIWMRNVQFTLCTVFLMSWPYRLFWNSLVVKKELQIVKQITFSVV